jgi:Thrombospondin type 3 repeat
MDEQRTPAEPCGTRSAWRLRSRALGACILTSVALLTSVEARAQTRPGVDLRTLRPSADPRAALVLEPTSTLRGGTFAINGWLSYSALPVSILREGGGVYARPVSHQLTLDLQASFGIGERVSVDLNVPMSLQASGSAALNSSIANSASVDAFALGDPWLGAKVNLRSNSAGGLGLSLRGGVTLPAGQRTAFTGERGLRPELTMIADYSLIVGGIQAQLGARVRSVQPEWPAESGLRFGQDVPWTIGAWFNPSILKVDDARRQRWEIALRGAIPMGPQYPFGAGSPGSATRTPVSLALSNRIELGAARDFSLVLAADIGLTAAVGVPAIRMVTGLRYAPSLHDADGDGIRDDQDQCPDVAEDRDGFEDDDGCPDIDDDKDDIPDKVDACPRVAGAASKDPKRNGCVPTDSDGDGVPDELDNCPRERGLESDLTGCNGCPDRDPDGDGLEAPADKCPTAAEDFDGFQDDDGCPDPDNDGDGIEDPADACPNVIRS